MKLTQEKIESAVEMVDWHARFDNTVATVNELADAYHRVEALLERWERVIVADESGTFLHVAGELRRALYGEE